MTNRVRVTVGKPLENLSSFELRALPIYFQSTILLSFELGSAPSLSVLAAERAHHFVFAVRGGFGARALRRTAEAAVLPNTKLHRSGSESVSTGTLTDGVGDGGIGRSAAQNSLFAHHPARALGLVSRLPTPRIAKRSFYGNHPWNEPV